MSGEWMKIEAEIFRIFYSQWYENNGKVSLKCTEVTMGPLGEWYGMTLEDSV